MEKYALKCYISAKTEKFSLKKSENVPKEDEFEKMLKNFLIGMNILASRRGVRMDNSSSMRGVRMEIFPKLWAFIWRNMH